MRNKTAPLLKIPGFQIPCVGLGTYKLAVEDVAPAVTAALEVGYRHIDCAHLYLNEEAVGNALKQWLDQTKTNREDVFITSKLWNTFHRPEFVGPACRASLERLKLSYLDLYLIHWPVAYKPGDDLLPVDEKGNTLFDDVDIITTWKAMEALVTEGLVRHIGLSNFNELQIQRIIDCANIKPVLLQIESNPYFPNQALIDFARANGIVSAAYAPLGSPYRDASCRLIDDPVLATIAKKYGKTPAQVAIRHGIQRGVSVVPKSRTPERIRENFENWQAEFQLWLPSVLHSSFLNDEEKPKVNGHQSAQQQPTPVVQSAPSLLSLISDSPPSHRPQSNSTEVATVDRKENAGEPQFPPPPPSPQGNQQKAQETPHEAPPFRLHVIKDTTKSLDARYQVVTEWARTGGVLLMGYEMFRLLTNPRKQTRANVSGGASFGYGGVGGGLSTSASTSSLFTLASSPFSADCERPRNRKKKRVITIDIEREEKEEHMLVDMRIALTDPGPQIVICDEGHRIKNSEASISRALKALRTRRRVVLTGYPLQNNLMEYWCMVDFVRPNYLGTKSEFTNMFQRPIENGQCVDSTEADRKLMQGRAHVLHELLSGFVQRRSHAVLKASLPPKQEVVLMVRMSPLQRRLYTALMNYIAVSSNMYGSGLPTANTLQTYALCCKIWNHPDILWRVVKENVDDMMDFELDDASNAASGTSSQRARRKPNGNTTNPPPPGANPAQSTGEDKYNWVTSDLWGAEFRAGDIQNSGKLVLFLSLLQESVRLGDKMLLFSQSLLTLDHLERILGQLPFDYATPSLAAKCVTPLAHQGEAEASQILHCQSDLKPESESAKQPQVWVRNVHYFRLDGSTSATDRDRLIRRFNDPENPVKLFLVSTRAGSLGVNLVGANRVVVFDASWNPCHDCQAVCRVYRYGQQKPCYIYRLVSDNTMERKIYDRQVNKQGVSDRVVDEMNPGQQFTRAQVGVLVAYEDKDMPTLTDEDLQSISDLTDSDPVLKAALETNKEWITAKPFTHESLLIDRKDYRLTRVEKRIARQRYEQERLISSSAMYRNSAAAATALQYHQYMMMVAASGSGGASFGNMSMGAPSSHRGTPNILSKSASGFHHQNLPVFPSAPHPFIPPSSTIDDSVLRRYEGIQRNRMLQKDLDEARIRAVSREIGIALPNGPLGSDYKITRVAATTDLVFPRSTHPPAPERSISKGEVVEIIQAGNNGKYLRLPRTGDIYVVKPGSKGPEPEDPQSHPVQKQSHNPPSASIPNPSSTLCPHCRQPSSSNCLCSNNLYPHSASTASSISNPSASAYHPPTYTNQYAPTGSYGPTAPHGYPNY